MWIVLAVVLIAAGIALMLFVQKKDSPNVQVDEPVVVPENDEAEKLKKKQVER